MSSLLSAQARSLGRPAVASSRRPIHATSSIASRQLPQRPSNSTNNNNISSCSSGSALLLFKWHVIARATDNFRPGSPQQQQQKEEAPTQDLHEPTAPLSPASSPLVGVQQGGLPTAVQNPSQGPVDHDSSSGSTAKATDNSIKKSGVAKGVHWRELPSGASQVLWCIALEPLGVSLDLHWECWRQQYHLKTPRACLSQHESLYIASYAGRTRVLQGS